MHAIFVITCIYFFCKKKYNIVNIYDLERGKYHE